MLLPGQYVRIRLRVGEQPDALMVPQTARGTGQTAPIAYADCSLSGPIRYAYGAEPYSRTPGIKRVRRDLLARWNQLVRLLMRCGRTPPDAGPYISIDGGRIRRPRSPDLPMLTDAVEDAFRQFGRSRGLSAADADDVVARARRPV